MIEEYTPHQIAAALRNSDLETEDHELSLDLDQALGKLPEPDRTILTLYKDDVSPAEALKSLSLKGNPQRLFNRAIRALTGVLNGKSVSLTKGEVHGENSTNRADVQREDHTR